MVSFIIHHILVKQVHKIKVVYHVILLINVPLHHELIVFPVCLFLLRKNIFFKNFFYFKDIPTSVFGDRLKQQVTDRLKFYDSGELPAKNVDVMQLALQEAEVEREQILLQEKKRKKKEKKRRKEAEARDADHANGTTKIEEGVNNMEVA